MPGTRRRNVSFDPHAYERTAPPIIESEFLQSNNRGAVQAEGLFCLSVFSLFTLFFRENVGKMWAKIGCREWCGYGVSGFLRLDIVTRLGYNGGVGKERR